MTAIVKQLCKLLNSLAMIGRAKQWWEFLRDLRNKRISQAMLAMAQQAQKCQQ